MTETFMELKPQSSFEAEMREEEHLLRIAVKQRELIVFELYRAAVNKCWLELDVSLSKLQLAHYRCMRMRLTKALTQLKHVAVGMTKALGHLQIGEETDGYVVEFPAEFTNIVKLLQSGIDAVTGFEWLMAVSIQPKLRNRVEKKLASKGNNIMLGSRTELATFSDGADADYPDPKAKLVAFDQWLIGEAAACLDKYRQPDGRKITGYDWIIAKLFHAAFGECRDLACITRALNSQKKTGRPQYVIAPFHLKKGHPSKNAPLMTYQPQGYDCVYLKPR